MTITIGFTTVADSISKMTVTGVTMKDIDKIPDAGQMICPVMFPQPHGFVTGTSVERMSLGGGGTALMDMSYVLNYVYLHAETGTGVSSFDVYSGIITNLAVIIKAILTNDNITGCVDMELNTIGEIGTVVDPAGNSFWGVLISFKILEQVQ